MPNPPLPPLNPGTGEPIGPEALAPLFPMELIKQEVSGDPWVEIPEEVREAYTLWRPTPMFRARNLEKILDTPAKIYYKFEGVGMTSLLPMYTLGHTFVPAKIHAGGLRYHGAGALISQLKADGLIGAEAIDQIESFEAGVMFAKAEGIIPAPEANHAVASVIRAANKAKEEGVSKTILFNMCGHGNFDMLAYQDYFAGNLERHEMTQDEVDAAVAKIDTPTIDSVKDMLAGMM